MTPNKELREKLSQAWYNCKYDEVGIEQHKKMDEFLEDNKDFILALIPQPEVMSEEAINKQIREIIRWQWLNNGLEVDAWNDLSKAIAHNLANKIPVEKCCSCGQLEIGKSYKRADNKPFSFKKEIGIFIGMTTGQDKFPRFKLNEKGMECFLNYQPTLENFIECKPIKQSAKNELPEELKGDWVTDGEKLSKIENKINQIIRFLRERE